MVFGGSRGLNLPFLTGCVAGTMGWMRGYEYRAMQLPAAATGQQTHDMLVIHAEFGDWELARHQVWPDGRRKVTVRRRISGEALPPLPS